MHVTFHCDRDAIALEVPDDAIVYESKFPAPTGDAPSMVAGALRSPIDAPPLREGLARRGEGDVVVVVSDITRPVPYRAFLRLLLGEIESAGVARGDILLLIATGNHRPSTPDERVEMFGQEVVDAYRIEDHRSQADDLVELPAPSWSGQRVRVNRSFMEAGFRLTTGLVEPHFMAGFSGGRKAVCPGLTSLETVENFHGYAFLADPRADNAVLEGNPLHAEALSVARQAGVDFSLNVVMNRRRELVGAFAGELDSAHLAACRFVRRFACPVVRREADLAVTSSGGHPLDATFYQCVKGFVSALPAVRPGGRVLAMGGCREGVGSAEYERTMFEYVGRWREYLEQLARPGVFFKDQWELQMQARALAKLGDENLHFASTHLRQDILDRLSVRGHALDAGNAAEELQRLLDGLLTAGRRVAVFPEGPYCAAIRIGKQKDET